MTGDGRGAPEPRRDAPAPEGPERAESAEQPEGARQDDARAELDALRDRYLRLAADFENFRRRVAQERIEARERAAAEVAERLLPVLDDAERTLAHVPPGVDPTWLTGLELMVRHLRQALASLGLAPIEAAGKPFDPRLHQAVGETASTDQPDGHVARELRRGYRLGDRVLRPALVEVARHPHPADAGSGPDDSESTQRGQ